MEKEVPARLSILGHPHRLAVFRLLMRRYPDRVPAGELANALALKPSTLSAYLSALMQAGLVTQGREGTSLRYAIAMDTVRDTFAYLLNDCCRGRPEICAPLPCFTPTGPAIMPDARYKVLFLCTGNSARSIFAEALLRLEAGDRFETFSAGLCPRSEVNPAALAILRKHGHDIAGLRAKHVSDLRALDAPSFDFVFTVCDQAANEDCPAWPDQPVSAHWGLPDPVTAAGPEAERIRAFQQAYDTLQTRIRSFAALPVATMDRLSLQHALDDIGQKREPA